MVKEWNEEQNRDSKRTFLVLPQLFLKYFQPSCVSSVTFCNKRRMELSGYRLCTGLAPRRQESWLLSHSDHLLPTWHLEVPFTLALYAEVENNAAHGTNSQKFGGTFQKGTLRLTQAGSNRNFLFCSLSPRMV